MDAAPHDPLHDDEAQAQFLRLFLSSERELFRYIAALVPNISDAEEIVQQTAVVLWSKFDQYDSRQPFTPWACGFAINIVKQWLASRKRWQSVLDGKLVEQLAGRRDELRPLFELRLRRLDGCLEKLPATQRSLVDAYYFHRRSIEVLAGESRRSVEATYKLLQRARAMLRQCIERTAPAGE